ncbi:MAG: hypothetical protein U0840_13060 [Gemmataceae bacterium]
MSLKTHTIWMTSLAFLATASLALGQFGGFKPPSLPDIKPPKLPDVKPPKLPDLKPPKLPDVKPPKLPDLNPLEAARKELERARRNAMKELRKLDPDTIASNLRESLNVFKSAAEAKTGVKVDERTGDIDLRQHSSGKTLQKWISKFAQGNEGHGELQEFRFNVRTGQMMLRLKAVHCQRQNWGPLGKVDLYSVTQTAKVSYDLRRREVDFNIDLGPLAPRISTKTVKALADGDVVKALESAGPEAINKIVKFERKNDYDKIRSELRRKHGDRNVYLASYRFVDWAGSSTIGKYLVDGALTGPGVWPKIMKDAQEMAAKELPDLVAWLESLGQKEARRMAEKLLTGQRPSWPFLKFEMIVVPHYAREVNPQTGVKTPWRRFNNLAFVVVFEPRYATR